MKPEDYAAAATTWFDSDLTIQLNHEPINDTKVCRILCRMWLAQLIGDGADENDYWKAIADIQMEFQYVV